MNKYRSHSAKENPQNLRGGGDTGDWTRPESSFRFCNRNLHTNQVTNGISMKKSQNILYIAQKNVGQGEFEDFKTEGEASKCFARVPTPNTHFPFRNFTAIKCFPNISGLETETLDIRNIHYTYTILKQVKRNGFQDGIEERKKKICESIDGFRWQGLID